MNLGFLPRSSDRLISIPVLLASLATLMGGCSSAPRKDSSARDYYRAGQAAALRHNSAAALADFTRARDLAADPDKAAWAQYQLASVYNAQSGSRPRARAALQALIRDYPSHFLATRAQADLDRLDGKKTVAPTSPRIDQDCGPECLAYLLSHSYGRTVSLAALWKSAGTGEHGTTLLGLQQAARAQGLSATGMKMDAAYLRRMDPPAILWVRRSHFVAMTGAVVSLAPPFRALRVYDPMIGREKVWTEEDLAGQWDGYVLALKGSTVLARR